MPKFPLAGIPFMPGPMWPLVGEASPVHLVSGVGVGVLANPPLVRANAIARTATSTVRRRRNKDLDFMT